MAKSYDEEDSMVGMVMHMQELLHSTVSDAKHAYDVLNNYDDDTSYNLSLSYLNMSYQSYLEFKRIYHKNSLEHYEIEPFIRDYEDYKHQLNEVITKKDSNTSWLYSAYTRLMNIEKEVNKFMSNWIKANMNN